MDEKKKQRNDYILIFSIVVCTVLMIVFFVINGSNAGSTVVVTVSGHEYGRYSLLQEQAVQINETNTLIIHNGTADMLFADCPDQVCVEHSPIDKTDENIICLPNRVVITIDAVFDGKDESGPDAIVK